MRQKPAVFRKSFVALNLRKRQLRVRVISSSSEVFNPQPQPLQPLDVRHDDFAMHAIG